MKTQETPIVEGKNLVSCKFSLVKDKRFHWTNYWYISRQEIKHVYHA